MTGWRTLVEVGPPEVHMPRDVRLAADAVATVRFFCWEDPAISLGFKQPRPAWLIEPRPVATVARDGSGWGSTGLHVVERPTGGGIALHGSDVSISVVIPRAWGLALATLMAGVCRSTARLCAQYGVETDTSIDVPGAQRITYCLAEPSAYAVSIRGRKVAGFAVRRFPETWLVQGSLLVDPLPTALIGALPVALRETLAQRAVALAERVDRLEPAAAVAARWASSWAAWWDEAMQPEAILTG